MGSTTCSPSALLVEDDPDAVTLFYRSFKRICPAWNLMHASDGLEAVSLMTEHGLPQLLVTDLQMPRMTGQELIAWVRTHHELPRVPILVMSSHSDPGIHDEIRVLGADKFLSKFSSLNEIHTVLRRFTAGDVETHVPANSH